MMAVVKFLENCPPVHLVKMNSGGKAQFALLGKPGNAFRSAYALLEVRCTVGGSHARTTTTTATSASGILVCVVFG